MDRTEKPENMKHDCYRALLEMKVGQIAEAIHLEGPYMQNSLIPNEGGQILISGKNHQQ